MKILVTGAAGFIGSNLVETLLHRGFIVIGLDNFDHFYDPKIKRANIAWFVKNPNFRLVESDILNSDSLDQLFSDEKPDLVIHLAARAGVRPSIEDPKLYQRVNIEGTLNVLECMKKYSIKKLIMASSSSVYGNNKKTPYAEADVVDFAISPYAATKKACEVIAHTYFHLYGIETFCLRFFTVYGPRQRPEMAIHQFTRRIQENKPITLFGDGSSLRDYTYIDDIVNGIVECIGHLKGFEIINLGESQTTSLIDLVRIIESEMDIKATIQWLPMQPGDVQKTFADITKAEKMIGYRPQIKIEEGIALFIKWFRTLEI